MFTGIFSSKTMACVSVLGVSVMGIFSTMTMEWVSVLGVSVYWHI